MKYSGPVAAAGRVKNDSATLRTRTSKNVPPVVPASVARRLLLHGQGLLDDPAAAPLATPRAVARLVERIGFVQVDTISTVERAHHLILAARMNGYRPAMLAATLERKPVLFEHWTHDASVIPLKWYPHWHYRFDRYHTSGWHLQLLKRLGSDADRVVAAVLERVTREGPLSSRDFEHEGEQRGKAEWWGWKPHKVALEYLWRVGKLHVVARRNFQKVYDLSERAIPQYVALPRPGEAEHVDWACRTALARLGVATVREVAQFWAAVPVTKVTSWMTAAASAGDVVPVLVEAADGSPPRPAFALPESLSLASRLPEPPAEMRLLCPFDPILRDRARAKRLFNFDFRFEGFVPAAQRKHGYYVMAVLEGERIVGKADPKFDRGSGTLRVRKVWWEEGVKPTRKRIRDFEEGVERLAGWAGATRVTMDE
jgi:uncharacterized protein YcaQ